MNEIIDELESGFMIQDSSTDIMNSMIQDLLDYAQIKVGKFRKNITSFNLREVIEKVVSIMRNKGQAKGIAMPIVYENIAESHEAYQRNYLVDGKISPIIQSDH